MIYRFGGFELHEERCELRRGHELLAVPRKSFEVLRLLLRRAGRVVSKEELFAEVWPGEHVSEQVLPVHMHTLRRTLGESATGEIIRTVRGRGYTVNCSVESATMRRSAALAQVPADAGLVGRGRVMEELQTEFWNAAAGHGRAVLLYGEAGIGKTRVLEEFARWAGRQNAIVLQARGEADPGAPPFWALIELLRSGRRALESEPLRTLFEQNGFDAKRSHEMVRTLFTASAERAGDPDSARFRLSSTLMRITRQVALIAPVVLVVDDVHAIDEGSLRVWTVAVRQLREERVMMLAAYREDDVAPEGRLARALSSLATESVIREIPLRGLEPEAVETLVRSEAGHSPPPAVVRSLCECTDGNPFFLRELLRLLAAEGKLAPGASDWNLSQLGLPRASRDAIERRLRTVSDACNELLVWAAVIGRRFSFPLLEAVSELPSASVLALLREAAEARIITTDVPNGQDSRLRVGEYCFAHGLFREAIYTRITAPERVLRHRAVGQAIERLRRSGWGEELSELAHHFFEAAPGGDIDRATQYCVQAARQALLLFGYDDAVRHFEHALRAEELRPPPDPLRLCCVTLGLADALRRAGRYPEAQTAFLQAAERAREIGREDLLAYSALGLAKWPRFVGPKLPFRVQQPPNSEQGRQVLDLVEEVLAALAQGGSRVHVGLQARMLSVQARAEDARGHRGSAAALGEQAVQLARKSEDRRALFDALVARRISMRMPQDAARALEVASELVEIAEGVRGRPLRLLFAAFEARIPALLGLGEMEAADRDLAAASEIAARVRVAEYQYTVARFHTARAIGDGRLQEVRDALDRYRSYGVGAGDCDVSQKRAVLRLGLYWLEGRGSIARAAMEALVEHGQVRSAADHAFQADYWRTLGDRQRCAEHFAQAAAQGFQDIEVNDDWLWTLCLCAHSSADLGDARRARQLYELIAPYARFNVTGSLGTYRGSAHSELGRLALVMGERQVANTHFESALAFNLRIGARVPYLFVQTHFGRALLAGSPAERSRGRRMIEAAAQKGEQLGIALAALRTSETMSGI